jgi:hypothetical protein
VKKLSHLFEIRGAPVIYDFNAAKIGALTLRRFANRRFVSKQRNPRDSISQAMSRSDHGAWIVSFWQDDVLGFGSGALANSLENFHTKRV